MTSNYEDAKEAIRLIGGDEVMTRIKARTVESCDGGVQFEVPLLGGRVNVRIVRAPKCWDLHIDGSVLYHGPQKLDELSDEDLGPAFQSIFLWPKGSL